MNRDPNLPRLLDMAREIRPLLDEVVFLGGCVTGLLITDPGAASDFCAGAGGRTAGAGAASAARAARSSRTVVGLPS